MCAQRSQMCVDVTDVYGRHRCKIFREAGDTHTSRSGVVKGDDELGSTGRTVGERPVSVVATSPGGENR